MRSSAIFAVLTGVLALSACQAPPPSAPTVTGPVLPLPPEAGAIPARPKVPARWRFTSAADVCSAFASGRGASLRVVLRRGHGASFVLSAPAPKTPGASAKEAMASAPTPGTAPPPPRTAKPRPEPGALRFAGRDGGWTAPARIGPGPEAVAYLKLDATAVGQIALLLGGGTLDPVGGPEALPELVLAPAGAAGRAWYGCARGLLF